MAFLNEVELIDQPEFLLLHLCRNIICVFPLHGRVRLEDGLDDVVGQVVLDAVGTV